MIQVAVVSGKGGTGKTMLTASCAALIHGNKVLIDADVDAANLALLLDPEDLTTEEFFGMDVAVINQDKCNNCGYCEGTCVFNAIQIKGDYPSVISYRCEGCGTCLLVCPEDAIKMKPGISGTIHTAKTRDGPLVYGSLTPGSGNSGLLVHRLKQKAGKMYPDASLILIDGPPGIGCPLISTITGVQIAIIVTEPSRSALHDLMRLITTCRSLKTGMCLVVNRYDLCPDITSEIIKRAGMENVPVIGRIPYDPMVVTSIRKGIPVVYNEGKASEAIHEMVENLISELKIYGTTNR